MSTRTQPNSLDAERSLLGSILLDNDVMRSLEGRIEAQHFYNESHRKIFRAMKTLAERGHNIDLITVREALDNAGELADIGGVAYLVELDEYAPTAAFAESYARFVIEKAVLRDLIQVGGRIMQMGYEQQEPIEEILDKAEKAVFELASDKRQSDFAEMRPLVKDTYAEIRERHENPSALVGLTTGFHHLDEMTAGLQGSALVVLAARPSMGKTAFALGIALNAALAHDVPVAIFSLEMSANQLTERLLCSEARIDMSRLRSGHLTENDFRKLAEAAGRVSDAQIFIDDNSVLTVMELRSRARRLKAEHGLGLIVIDYLQLMSGGRGHTENRQQEIANITRGLKTLARELDVPILVASQLSRAAESRTDRRPMLMDLRESGAIEQDADLVMFIYRDEYYNPDTDRLGIAEIIIGKQRNGPVGTVELQFHNAHVRFNNLVKERN